MKKSAVIGFVLRGVCAGECLLAVSVAMTAGAWAAELPAGYMAVDYVASTPGGGQYIDTEYTPNKNTKVVFRMLDDGMGAYQSFGAAFGSRAGYSQGRGMFLWLRYWDKNAPSYGRAGAEIGLEKSDFPFGDITTVTCLGRECSWRNDAGTKSGRIDLASNHNYDENQEAGFAPLLIFAVNSPGEQGGRNPTDCWGFRLYSFKIYEGDALKRDFVPCLRVEDSAVGLYDKIEERFHANAGTGNFCTSRTLESGTYDITESFAIVAPAGESALKLANGANVTLNISAGVTVTLHGGDASGTTGAGAGIEVPANAKLIIGGAGTLNATGGNAADGAKGGQGTSASYDETTSYVTSASGGAGGNGGGGAGAGIGGTGGTGGNGRKGGDAVTSYWNVVASGNSGTSGDDGGKGGACGTVLVRGMVIINAVGGAAGSGGAGGYKQNWCVNWGATWYWAGYGSGGGGGGGGGGAAPNIGGGGGGGGGGNGGGSGGITYYDDEESICTVKMNGEGGAGGKGGAGIQSGGNGTQGDDFIDYGISCKWIYIYEAQSWTDPNYSQYTGGNANGVVLSGGGTGAAGAMGDASDVNYEVGQSAEGESIQWNPLWEKLSRVKDGVRTEIAYETVNGDTSTFENGKWYVVKGDVSRGESITVGNAVNLVLVKGELKVNGSEKRPGIGMELGDTFNIYGTGSGVLVAMGGWCGAGIGAGKNDVQHPVQYNFSTVIINGGTVTATGGEYGAGIGGGCACVGGTVIINGGVVTANGGEYGAGIGGGYACAGGTVTINGGTVTATGKTGGAGIGGGNGGTGGMVTINGSNVKASSIQDLRGRPRCAAGTPVSCVVIEGSSVDGLEGYGMKDVIPIDGKYYFYLPNGMHYFNVDGQRRVAFVNDGATLVTDESQVRTASFAVGEHIESVHYTTVPAIANGTATGDFTLPLVKGMSVTLDVVCDEGYGCFNAKTLTVGDAGLNVALTAERVSLASVDYRDANGEAQTATDVTIVGPRLEQTLTNGWYVVCDTVELESLTVEGAANLILMDGAKLTATAVTNEAGIAVTAGNSLTIYGQKLGTGELVAKNKWVDKGAAGACIGGVLDRGCGAVTINGGTITAISEAWGAGIGGAYYGTGGIVTINGGKVTARGLYSAGIGNGCYGSDTTVTINGGTVEASHGYTAADIGTGYYGSSPTVTINGGNVKAATIQNAPTNSANAAVWCVTVDVEKLKVEKLKVEGLDGYGTRDIVPIDGKVYLYLPDGIHTFTIDGEMYSANVKGANTTAVKGLLVVPGVTARRYATAAEASNAMAKAVITPSAEVESKLGAGSPALGTYCDLFGLAVTGGDADWYVVAFLKPEAWTNVAKSAAEATRQIPLADIAAMAADGKKDVAVSNCVPGFYYTLYGAEDLGLVTPRSEDAAGAVDIYGPNLSDAEGKVTFPAVAKPSAEAGFFTIGVSATKGE